MLTPYEMDDLDIEYQRLTQESDDENILLSLDIETYIESLGNYLADSSAENLAVVRLNIANIEYRLVSLSDIESRRIDLGRNAAPDRLIMGYSTAEIVEIHSARNSAFAAGRAEVLDALDGRLTVADGLKSKQAIGKFINVFGEAAGYAVDVGTVAYDFFDEDYYGAAGGASGALVSYAAGAVALGALGLVTTVTWPWILGVGLISGSIGDRVSKFVERKYEEFNVLGLGELNPNPENNPELVKRLEDAKTLIYSLGPNLTVNQQVRILDASSNEHGNHVDSFFNMVRNYFVGGDQFYTMRALMLSIRQA